jgi:hypothetical protein
MIDSSVVIFLLSFNVEVCAQSPGNHVNDPMERLISEVLLFGCWWGWWRILVMWWWRKGLDLLVLLVHMVLLVGVEWFIVELSLVVLLGVVGVCNNSLVVGWLISGILSFVALFSWQSLMGVRGVFTCEKGSRTFAVVGLGLYLCLWGCRRGPVVWGTLGDERCLQSAVDWQ